MSNVKIFSGIQYYFFFFLKNKHIFEGNMSYSLVGNTFQSKLVSEQTLITATVINYKIILVLYDLNSNNQAY